MLSHSLKLQSKKAKGPTINETKVLMCGLLTFVILLAFFPIAMLSLVELQPEMMSIPYMLSQVNHRLKQSGVAMEKEGCTVEEHELFNSWHMLAHMENKLLEQTNSSRRGDAHEVHEEQSHINSHPGLLSVDAVGHAILNTNLSDFQGKDEHEIQMPHKETGTTRAPTSLGQTPVVLPSANASLNQHTNEQNTTATEVASTNPAHLLDHPSHPTLHWTPHATRKSGSFMRKRSQKPHYLALKDLHSVHWQGKIPKVTCIMAVPATTRAHVRLKYVVNNFLSQHYEGPKRLIVVYHYQDHKGAERIQKLADGHYIKAVPARTMEVPSSTALRYGLWSADHDTDIVARWDVDGWHHPQRLAMQVRALAMSGQQACLLSRWTVAPGDGSRSIVDGNIGGSSIADGNIAGSHSILGERAWMDKNWQPYLPAGDQALAAEQDQLVLIDVPELLVTSPEDKELSHNSTAVHEDTASQ
eukprot:gnl/MRDRNA2_/MRDRNA2_88176_c0_seq1.p1 gnl/MRDRNA2_/MRDRNA2_88176_c0~~gnl/MRDRNA2_/MRDRNA2_88176_c0_seq1.p1  ORF type:complete len:471 (-),score=80.74 gnl/MRDRNA2_/MRDRNA2_88176_c0_seq1:39-1451(-)